MHMRTLVVAAALALALVMEREGARCAAEPKHSDTGMCRSVGVLKFDPSQRSMQRSKGLEVCSKYKKNTCCNETHALPLRLKIREPVVAKFNPQCQKITEEMACSACHPFMGTNKMKSVCPRLCDDWYSACRREFYSYGAGAGSLTPCYGNALVCSPLSVIAADGAEFCSKMGFPVGKDDDSEGDDCFDGSVPRQLGQAEPTEPWQSILKRLFQEQSENPSGDFMVLLFAPLMVLLLAYRFLKKSRSDGTGDPFGRSLTLEEVRALQQARYGVDGYDSDSSSPPPEDDEQDDEFMGKERSGKEGTSGNEKDGLPETQPQSDISASDVDQELKKNE